MIFSFGQSERERIEIDVLNYERVKTGEYWDDNWLAVNIRVKVGGFSGGVSASITTAELAALLPQIRSLFSTLKGEAKFETMEGQLNLHLKGDGKGEIELKAEIQDRPGIGNRLNFSLDFDQSQLGASLQELQKVVEKFPVRLGAAK